jgi:hypothetical protein
MAAVRCAWERRGRGPWNSLSLLFPVAGLLAGALAEVAPRGVRALFSRAIRGVLIAAGIWLVLGSPTPARWITLTRGSTTRTHGRAGTGSISIYGATDRLVWG